MHVPSRGVLGGPHADRVLGYGVEIPDELAGLGVIGAQEAADTELPTTSADENLAVHRGRRLSLKRFWIYMLIISSLRKVANVGFVVFALVLIAALVVISVVMKKILLAVHFAAVLLLLDKCLMFILLPRSCWLSFSSRSRAQ